MVEGNTVAILKHSKWHAEVSKNVLDHDKILNNVIHMGNRETDVLKNLRDKK